MLTSPESTLAESMGGAPIVTAEPSGDGEGKEARKLRKHALKIQRDAELPPKSFERFKILAELVNEGRQIIDLADHRARYALVVLGVLNTAVVVAISDLFGGIASVARPWFIGAVAAYAVITGAAVFFAVECLRPRRLYRPGADRRGSPDSAAHGSFGLLFWETVSVYELDQYRQAWAAVRMEHLNAEVVTLAHSQSRVIRAKYEILGRLFNTLVVLVVMGVLLVATAGLLNVSR
jgi:hypothetical protein